MTPSLREITRFEGRNIFQPLSPVRYHACLSSYAKLAKTNQAISRKWPKTYFVAKIWPILAHIWPKYFFQPLRPPLPVRYHACLSSYAKLEKTNDAISRKWPKTSFWAKFWPFLAILGPNNFFFENRASSLKIVYGRLTWCKKSERSNGGKYENLVGRTDWQTDRLTELVT